MKYRILLITLFISAFSWGQATLPVSRTGWTGAEPTGWTQTNTTDRTTISACTGNDACIFDATNDVISVNFTGTPNLLTFKLKKQSLTGTVSKMVVEESPDGAAWSLIGSYGAAAPQIVISDCADISVSILSTSRYVRWTYTKGAGNCDLDDVSITIPACTPPSDPVGSISGTTPECNSTSLSFSGSATAPVVNYWQTSASGTSTTNDAASPLAVTTVGTNNYYVRAYNSSTSCWSTSAVASAAITINNNPGITTNPSSASVVETNNTSFTVVATNPGTYQWQVSTDGGTTYNNVSNGGVYSGATSATLTITGALLTMNGYKYKCFVNPVSPCATIATSGVATLTVTEFSDNKSDLFYLTGSSVTTISSTINTPSPLTISTGVQAMQFLLRDGGATGIDADALPTILTGFTILQSANTATDWSAAIKTIALFDGTTYVANGIISASSIVFSGLTVSTLTDGGTRTLSLRMSLNCPLGSVVDGEYFGFSISNVNTTVAASGTSRMTTFTAIKNVPATGGTLKIDVTATKLVFTTQPTSTGLNNTMTTVVVRAYDACNNLDKGFTGTVSLASSGTMTAVTPVAAVAGVATFSGIVHTAIGTNLTLTATSTVTAAVSTFFDIAPVTVLQPGDVAVLAVNTTNASADDEISFVSFVDITPGTRIDITDNAFQKCGTTNGWGISEGWMRLERKNTTLTKGTIITITVNNSTGLATIASPDPSNWISSKPQPSLQGVFNLNPGGEQVFFMAGGSVGGTNGSSATSDAGTYSGNFLFGFNTKGNVWTPFCANAAGGGTTNSDKPLNFDCFLTWPTSQSDYNKYTGLMTDATQRDWVSRISNSANWSAYANDAAYNAGPNFYGASINILNGGYSSGTWIGDVNTDWFNCSNWQARKVPDSTVNVIVGATASQGVKIDITSPNAASFSNLAKCKDLTISDYNVTIEASSSNVLEVNGNLAISPSGVIDMDDSNTGTADGIIKLKGNWTNSVGNAAFSEGNGTVQFVGTTPQLISSVATEGTEIFYNVVLDNNFDTTVSNDLIASGDLTIKTGRTVNIDSNGYIKAYKKLDHSGDLTIESNGQFIQVDETDINTGTYTGTKFQVTRNYTATNVDYVYWGAPTKSFAVSNLPSGYRYEWNPLFYNTNTTQGNWIAPSTTDMTAGKGYIARTFNGSATAITLPFTFRGQPNNGTITVPISRGSYYGDGITTGLNYTVPSNPNPVIVTRWDDNWNLVSNPYPSAINALTFLSALNNPDIEGFVYLWTHQQGLVSTVDPYYNDFILNYSSTVNYVLYNRLGNSSGPISFNGKIASGQGFFVLMSDGPQAIGTGTVTFNNTMRYTATTFAPYNNSQFFKTTTPSQETLGEEEKHRIWLDIVSAQGDSNRTLIGYVENATNDKDRMYDAITKLDNSLKIVSYLNEENPQEFSIQGRGLPFNENDTVRLGVAIPSSGAYTIGIGALDGMFDGSQNIYIEDKLLNVIQSINTQPYTFTSNAGRFENRFLLRYTDGSALDNPDFETLDSSVVVATNHGEMNIKSFVENIQEVTVYDVLGRQLFFAKAINNKNFVASNISMSQQTLIVKIKLENGIIVTRKIIL